MKAILVFVLLVIAMPVQAGDPFGTMPTVIASGTATFATTAVASGACQTAVTVAATGAAVNTDVIDWAFRSAPAANTDQRLITHAWLTAGNVVFQRCNPTAASITPTALVLNWKVIR